MVGVARVPLILLQRVAVLLQQSGFLTRAWIHAILEQFPDTPLGELHSKDPSLLPSWLLEEFATYHAMLVLRHGGIFLQSFDAHKVRCTSPSILAATSTCRFREGFASEGMLCNDPPIPLRVLDFLEHAEDLLNLALVCKATHQAGHVLLQREFGRGDVGPWLAARGMRNFEKAIKRRKRSMLESALRHPIGSSTASASMVEAADADAVFHVDGKHALSLEMDGRCWDELDFCMLTLLRATELPTACPSAVEIAHPSPDWHPRDGGVEGDWQLALERRLEKGVVMDTAAVGRAIAQWAELNVKDPDRSSGQAAIVPEHVMRVVRAAERHGQGVIVHYGCYLHADLLC